MSLYDTDDWPLLLPSIIPALSDEVLLRNAEDCGILISNLEGKGPLAGALQLQLSLVQGEIQQREASILPSAVSVVHSHMILSAAAADSDHTIYNAIPHTPISGSASRNSSTRSTTQGDFPEEQTAAEGYDPYALYGTVVYDESTAVLGPDSVAEQPDLIAAHRGGLAVGLQASQQQGDVWVSARSRAAAAAAAIGSAPPLPSSMSFRASHGAGAGEGGRAGALPSFVIEPTDAHGKKRRKKRMWELDKEKKAKKDADAIAKSESAPEERAALKAERAAKLQAQIERQQEREAEAARAAKNKKSAELSQGEQDKAAREAKRAAAAEERKQREAAREERHRQKALAATAKQLAAIEQQKQALVPEAVQEDQSYHLLANAHTGAAIPQASASAVAPPSPIPIRTVDGPAPAEEDRLVTGQGNASAFAEVLSDDADASQAQPASSGTAVNEPSLPDGTVLMSTEATAIVLPQDTNSQGGGAAGEVDTTTALPGAAHATDTPLLLRTPGTSEVQLAQESAVHDRSVDSVSSGGTSEEPEDSDVDPLQVDEEEEEEEEEEKGSGLLSQSIYDSSSEDEHDGDASEHSVSTDEPATGKMRYSLPAAGLLPVEAQAVPETAPQPPPSYADVFPDFASIFTGCSKAAWAVMLAGNSRNSGKSAQIPVSAETAGGHQLKVLAALRAWQAASGRIQQARCSTALSALGPEPEDHLLLSTPYNDGDDDGDGPHAQGGRPPSVQSQASARGGEDGAQVDTSTVATPDGPTVWFRAIESRDEVYSIVHKGLSVSPCGGTPPLARSWWECPQAWGTAPVWSFMWSWSRPPVHRSLLLAWQKVNHFKGNNELARKDLLKRNLARYAVLGQRMAKEWDLQPATFILPKEYLPFCEAFGRARMDSEDAGLPNIWIMKPVGLSRGRGIKLVSDIGQVRYSEPMVIQQYIARPLTLHGYKFDLRIYVLVTSFQPLEAFIYRRGFARLSTERYTTSSTSLDNKYIHLTNAAVQKNAVEGAGDVSSRVEGADTSTAGGSKISLDLLWRRLKEDEGVDTQQLWERICDVVVKSLLCADDVIPHQVNSFELFGYDILIERDGEGCLRPWLLEVNSSPSLAVDSPMDEAVKSELMSDTLRLVDPLPYNHAALDEALQRRMKIAAAHARGGPSAPSAASGLSVGPAAKAGGRQGGQQAGVTGQSMSADDRLQLDRDLANILYGRKPRPLGEMPAHLGQYQRLAPGTAVFARALKLKMQHIRGRAEVSSVPGPAPALPSPQGKTLVSQIADRMRAHGSNGGGRGGAVGARPQPQIPSGGGQHASMPVGGEHMRKGLAAGAALAGVRALAVHKQ